MLSIAATAPRLAVLKQSQKICLLRSLSSSTSSTDTSSSASPDLTCDVVQGPNLLRTPAARPSPSLMFLPGLRSLPFWTSPDYTRIAYGDPMVTHVVEHLQKHSDMIRTEYLEQQNEKNKLPPTNDYHDHQKSLHEGKWEWFSYLNKGNVQGNFAFQFPKTAKILHELRKDHLLFEGTPFGFCFFSNLHGNSSIQAHTSPMNLRLRVHLPLIVPSSDDDDESCAIRVGNMARPWIQDKAMVLDDSYNHEVWNRTSQERVLLLVDIWHPDISLVEKKEIVGMFQQARQDGLWKR